MTQLDDTALDANEEAARLVQRLDRILARVAAEVPSAASVVSEIGHQLIDGFLSNEPRADDLRGFAGRADGVGVNLWLDGRWRVGIMCADGLRVFEDSPC
jgi:hypothetical protein